MKTSLRSILNMVWMYFSVTTFCTLTLTLILTNFTTELNENCSSLVIAWGGKMILTLGTLYWQTPKCSPVLYKEKLYCSGFLILFEISCIMLLRYQRDLLAFECLSSLDIVCLNCICVSRWNKSKSFISSHKRFLYNLQSHNKGRKYNRTIL